MELADSNYAKSAARSCTTCSKAKAKCVRHQGQVVCERCARLKKECQMREPVIRRKKASKTTRAAQLEKLEHKIEHLVNALSTNTQQRPHQLSSHGQLSPPISQISSGLDRAAMSRTAEVLESLCSGGCEEEETPPSVPLVYHSPGNFAEAATPGPSLEETEVLLDRYRRLMAPGFPFVVIPDGATAQSMLETKPVLLKAICTVAYVHDLSRQQSLMKEMIANIGDRILVKSEKSIDIIQAILVIVMWYHPHIFHGTQMTSLVHLAIAMTIDMGIDRMSPLQDFKQLTTKAMHGACITHRIPTLEERRALLGLFFSTSFFSTSFKKIDAISFTPYMEDCLNALPQAREYDSDLFLVQLVRVQRVIEAISATNAPSTPPQMFIKAFRADIERLRKDDPCKDEPASNIFLGLQYLTAEVFTWELSLIDLQENQGGLLSAHLQDLYHLVASIKGFFDLWWTIPASAYLLLPFSAFGHYAHSFIALMKLASLDIDGWDLKALNEECSLIGVIDESARRYEEVARVVPEGLGMGTTVDNDAFARWAFRVKWMKQVYEAKFAAAAAEGEDMPEHSRPASSIGGSKRQDVSMVPSEQPFQFQQQQPQQPTPPDDFLSADFFGYLDEGFWNSFAGDLPTMEWLAPDVV